MKKQLMMIAIAGCMIAATGCTVDGYVTSRPDDVVYARPIAPGADYVWIDGDWVWGGGRYVWHGGHWEHGRPGRIWQGGRWQSGSRGYRWQRGHWR